jgi:hypothetical protein
MVNRFASLSATNYLISQATLSVLFAEFTVWLAKFSQFLEYVAKQVEIKINKMIKTTRATRGVLLLN